MKNHFIPCFYTKRWTGADRKLVRFTRPRRDLVDRRKYPQEVGFKTDLYTLPGIQDETKDMLENEFFREIDQNANDVLNKIENLGVSILTHEDRINWVLFLISLRQRNPQSLTRIARRGEQAFQNDIEDYRRRYNELEREVRNQSFDEFVQELKDDGWFARTNKLLVRGAITLPGTTEALFSFQWDVIQNKSLNHKLLTSDRPVIMTNGLAHNEGHVAFPIGPRRLFVAARDRDVMSNLKRYSRLSETSNRLVVGQAWEEVYSTDLSQASFIAHHFGESPDERDAP